MNLAPPSSPQQRPASLRSPRTQLDACQSTLASSLLSFPVALLKPPDEISWREQALSLAYGSRAQSVVAGKPEHLLPLHPQARSRERWRMLAHFLHFMRSRIHIPYACRLTPIISWWKPPLISSSLLGWYEKWCNKQEVHMSLQRADFISFEYMTSNKIAASQDSSICSLMSNICFSWWLNTFTFPHKSIRAFSLPHKRIAARTSFW